MEHDQNTHRSAVAVPSHPRLRCATARSHLTAIQVKPGPHPHILGTLNDAVVGTLSDA